MQLDWELGNCFGCSACAMICPKQCIEMKLNEKGFYTPYIDMKSCIQCGKCKAVCQQNMVSEKIVKKPIRIYGVKHKNDSVRMNCASGGMFAALVEYVLLNKGFVVGAKYSETFDVYHDMSDSETESTLFYGSKYVQSDLNDIFKKIKQRLLEKRMVLFSGTPCQVVGLMLYLGREFENLITVNLICHGNASNKIYRDFVRTLESKKKVKKIEFRDKERGWNNQVWSCTYRDRRKVYNSTSLAAYKSLYYSGLVHNTSCYECPYASYDRPGDFTIGDFWGIDKYNAEFNDNLGVSLVFTHTPKAEQIFKNIKSRLKYIITTERECEQFNLHHPTPKSYLYEKFWKDYLKKGYTYIVYKYANIGMKGKAKSMISLIKEKYIKNDNVR